VSVQDQELPQVVQDLEQVAQELEQAQEQVQALALEMVRELGLAAAQVRALAQGLGQAQVEE
jgi:uncharacterized phage infection (PIP) family protein YhgE